MSKLLGVPLAVASIVVAVVPGSPASLSSVFLSLPLPFALSTVLVLVLLRDSLERLFALGLGGWAGEVVVAWLRVVAADACASKESASHFGSDQYAYFQATNGARSSQWRAPTAWLSTNEGQGNDMYAENDSWAYLEHRANWGVLAATAMMTTCRASSGVKGTA